MHAKGRRPIQKPFRIQVFIRRHHVEFPAPPSRASTVGTLSQSGRPDKENQQAAKYKHQKKPLTAQSPSFYIDIACVIQKETPAPYPLNKEFL
jgi:hypothetical protein